MQRENLFIRNTDSSKNCLALLLHFFRAYSNFLCTPKMKETHSNHGTLFLLLSVTFWQGWVVTCVVSIFFLTMTWTKLTSNAKLVRKEHFKFGSLFGPMWLLHRRVRTKHGPGVQLGPINTYIHTYIHTYTFFPLKLSE